MAKRVIHLIPLIVASLMGTALVHFTVSAQEATIAATPAGVEVPAFSIQPVGDHPDGFFRDIQIAPGTSMAMAVEIQNTGTIPVELTTFKVNALNGVNGGYVSGDPADAPIGLTAWIDYPTQALRLDPLEDQEIPFTVTVPDGTPPGQYIAGLVAQTTASLEIPGTDAFRQYLASAISVGILVPGDITPAFELGTPEMVASSASQRLSIPITNSGNYLVRPAGELTLTNADGEQIVTSKIEMGSLYAGRSTTIETALPEQMPAGTYTLNITLRDEGSGASAALNGVPVSFATPERSTPGAEEVGTEGVTIANAEIRPNEDPIVFAEVALTLDNGGQQLPAVNVTLEVLRDGQHVEMFPLAANQVLLSGENEISARYIPAEGMWDAGMYTFRVVVSAVDPQGGMETILMAESLEPTIDVP